MQSQDRLIVFQAIRNNRTSSEHPRQRLIRKAGFVLFITATYVGVYAGNSSCAPQATEPQSIKLEDAFEVGKAHLDLLPLSS